MNKLVMNSLVCSLLLLGAGCSPRSSAAPEGALSAERSFKPPVPERWTLPNGLTVMYLKDTELPLVTGTIYVRAGGLWEPEGRIGIAGAMGELMRQGGAGNLSADALDERLEKLSASVSSSVGGEFGSVAFGSLSGDFETVFGLATDVLLRPRFEQSRIELWKGQSLEGIRRRTDDPWTVAGIAFGQLVYGNTPYGRVGIEKDVKAINGAELRKLHESFIRPDGALVVVTGAVEREKVEQLINEKLGDWKPRGAPIGSLPPVDFVPEPGVYYVHLPLSQASVYVGEQGVARLTPDYPAIEGFNQIFGSGFFGSRLVKKIRAELGLVYGIFGGISAGPVKGKNFIGFQTKGESAGAAIRHSIDELLKLQNEPPPIEELREVQRAVSNSFIFRFESSEKAINRRANQELLGYPADFDDTYLGKIQALTPEDVQSVARRRWDLSKLVIIVVGNETAYSSLEKMLKDPPPYLAGKTVRKLKFDQKILM